MYKPKPMLKPLLFSLFSLIAITLSAQGIKIVCNDFEDTSSTVFIDSNSIWQKGQPSTSVFNDSYQGMSSMVTNLDSNYLNNDTSDFYLYFSPVPNYLGFYQPVQIEFYHRFELSIFDRGEIHMSMDGGQVWHDVLSSDLNANLSEYYKNEHVYLSSGDTVFDSLSISGDSTGWIHSKFAKEIQQIIDTSSNFNDSIILRFRLVSDSVQTDEGWQIDSLCVSVGYITGIEEKSEQSFALYPNPSDGQFTIDLNDTVQSNVFIRNVHGQLIFNQRALSKLELNLSAGLYFVTVENSSNRATEKLIVR